MPTPTSSNSAPNADMIEAAVLLLTEAVRGVRRDRWAEVDAVLRLRSAGWTIRQISDRTGMSGGTVRNRLLIGSFSFTSRRLIPTMIPWNAAFTAARMGQDAIDWAESRARHNVRTTVNDLQVWSGVRRGTAGATIAEAPTFVSAPLPPVTDLAQGVRALIDAVRASNHSERQELLDILSEASDLLDTSERQELLDIISEASA